MNPSEFKIERLGLQVRTETALKNHKLNTVKDVIILTPPELLKVKNFGTEALRDLVFCLIYFGWTLKRSEFPGHHDAVARGWEIIRKEQLQSHEEAMA